MFVVAGAATVALNLVAPDIGIFAAIALVVVLMGFAAEGAGGVGDFFDPTVHQRKREVLSKMLRRGRPGWSRTAPDHADEPPELIWERERRRRGLR